MGLNWKITFESFKFYKLEAQTFLRIAFVSLIIINFLAYGAPIGDRNFEPFLNSYSANVSPQEALSTLSEGNRLVLIMHFVSLTLSAVIALLYAQCWTLEHSLYLGQGAEGEEQISLLQDLQIYALQLRTILAIKSSVRKEKGLRDKVNAKDKPEKIWEEYKKMEDDEQVEFDKRNTALGWWKNLIPQQESAFSYSLKSLFLSLPRILLFLFLLGFAYISSVVFYGLPYYFYLSAFILAPFFFMRSEKFFAGMKHSYEETYGLKLLIVSRFFILKMSFYLVEALLTSIFTRDLTSFALVLSLLHSIKSLVYARFGALMFISLSSPKNPGSYATSSL